MEESESECVHKNINKEKGAKNKAEYKKNSVTYDPVFNKPSYFNVFECGKNLLNKFDTMY